MGKHYSIILKALVRYFYLLQNTLAMSHIDTAANLKNSSDFILVIHV